MTKNTAKKTNDMPAKVNIVDGKLILSLPNAQMPVVWQMDLEKAQSSAFTIQEDKKKKNFTLILKAQDGSIDEIAPFDDRQTSVDILMEISNVLQSAHGQIKPATIINDNNTNIAAPQVQVQDTSSSNKAGAITAMALIIVLALIWMISASGDISKRQGASDDGSTASFSNTGARESAGVPVSADDFLNNR